MYNPPEMKKYHSLVSATIITILAAFILVFGIISLIAGFNSSSSSSNSSTLLGLTGASLGITLIITSAFLFAMANIAEDIHYKRYLQENSMDEMEYYHYESLCELEEIKNLLAGQQQGNQTKSTTWPSQTTRPASPPLPTSTTRHTPTGESKPAKEPIKHTPFDE